MKITDLKNYSVVSSTGVQPPQPQQPTGFGQKILNAGTAVSNFFGGKGVADAIGSDIAKIKTNNPTEKAIIASEKPSQKQIFGSALQLGANFLPGAAKGVGLAGKIGTEAATGYAFDAGSKLQNNQAPTPGIGTAVGVATPLAGAVIRPATKIVGRLLKGLGSGLSGVSTETIDKIVNNPRAAEMATEKLSKSGNAKFLEENARTIMNGVSTIRKEASKAFGEGIESLAQTDIKPEVYNQKLDEVLSKYKDFEFSDPKNVTKAKELIQKATSPDLNGKSLRKLMDDIQNTKYKIATSDERLSFNAFTKDLAEGVKNAVISSTDKLGEINQKFSKDMQLTEAVEDIFGKVKFKNLPEVVKATKKLEGLFAQKGIAPEVVDDFLKRIGVSPEEFKTGEAVRQISNKTSGANTKGLSVGEVMQQATSAVVSPQLVRDIAIKIGVAEQTLLPELKKLNPAVRDLIMNALNQNRQ